MTIESPVLVLNPYAALVQAAKLQRPEVDVPDPIVDLLQPDVLADAEDRHVHPAAVPANAAVGANVPNLEAIRVLERWQPIGHRSERRRVARGRRLLVERLVRPLVVELLAKDSAAEANRSTLIADIPSRPLETSQPSGARAKNERSESDTIERRAASENPLRATTINDFAKLGTALGGRPTIVERLLSRATSFGMAVGAEDTLGVLRD